MIHPKSSNIVMDDRHLYGPGHPKLDQLNVRVTDIRGQWAAYYRFGGVLTLVAFSYGEPPATLAVEFSVRNEILEHCLGGVNPVGQIVPEQEGDVA